MRSCLISLRVLLGDSIADMAEIAWAGLSHACHHHAYELTPTDSEVRHLIKLASTVIAIEATLDPGNVRSTNESGATGALPRPPVGLDPPWSAPRRSDAGGC
jgi:hypothetical protein